MTTPTQLTVAIVQLGFQPGESRSQRVERVEGIVLSASEADLVVLPELWATGYFSFGRYSDDAESIDGAWVTRMSALARAAGVYLVAGSFIESSPGGLTNCAVVFSSSGDMLHTYRKVHLFGYESEEARLLQPGTSIDTVAALGTTMGLATCYDLRFPELFRLLVDHGAELLVVPAAWPTARLSHWQLLLRARAVENQAFVIGSNGAGTQHGVDLAGHSAAIDPDGRVIAQAGDGPEVVWARLDLGPLREVRAGFPVLEHRRLVSGSIREE